MLDKEFRLRTLAESVDLNRQLITPRFGPGEDPMSFLDRMTRIEIR